LLNAVLHVCVPSLPSRPLQADLCSLQTLLQLFRPLTTGMEQPVTGQTSSRVRLDNHTTAAAQRPKSKGKDRCTERERERERERAHLLWLTAGETLSSQYTNCHTPGVSTDSNFHTLTHSAFFLSQFLSHTGLTLLFVFLCPRCSLSLSKLSQLSFVRWLLSLGLSVPCLLHPPAATTTSWNVVTFEGSLCDRTHSHTYKGGTILLPCTDSVDLDYFSSFILFHYTSISFISF